MTGRQVYHRATIQGTDDAAIKRAEDKLAEFRTKVLNQRSAASSVSFSYAVDEWMRTSEIEDSTRKTYLGYIASHIKPVLGKVPIKKVDVRTLESFYTELRRCRIRCDGKPFIVHKKAGEHDCAEEDCQPHKCKALAASTIQQIHSIISVTLAAAERWDWINSNPARITRRPSPQASGARPADHCRSEPHRRGSLQDGRGLGHPRVARHDDRDAPRRVVRPALLSRRPGAEVIDLRRNWVLGKEKDTKTHQNRRIALDSETVALLREHRARVVERVETLSHTFSDELFMFSNARTPDHSEPYSPNAVTQRYKDMVPASALSPLLAYSALPERERTMRRALELLSDAFAILAQSWR